MVENHQPTSDASVSVQLLDASQGHPLQTWSFSGDGEIKIGRNEENDVPIADPHVSRVHARLIPQDGQWKLISVGRHGTLVDDRVIAEMDLDKATVFQLGPSGPMLRFEAGRKQAHYGETIDRIDPDMFKMLEVDELKKKQEVDQITGNALFQELREQSRRFKSVRNPDKE